MPSGKLSIGQAIDKIIKALEGLDEKSRPNVISTVCTQLGLANPIVERKLTPPSGGGGQGAAPGAQPTVTVAKDIRQLTEEKQPKSAIEMACLVAYYLMSIAQPPEQKDTVKMGDLRKYFIHAKYPLPRQIKDLLSDSKAAGYFDSVGRGTYRLNAVGHNLVVHSLPRKKKE